MNFTEILDSKGIEWLPGSKEGEVQIDCQFCPEMGETPDTRKRLGVNVIKTKRTDLKMKLTRRYKRLYNLFNSFVIFRKKGCWKWSGRTDYQGYAVIHGVKAARISYEKYKGPIPFGLCVLHKCDNPVCTKPTHLWKGTKGQNNTDRAVKGRNKFNWETLTIDEVKEIRKRGDKETRASLAREFGVSNTSVWQIITRRSYKYVK